MMGKRILVSSLIGAIVAFAWMWLSWMVMPWHDNVLNKVTDEAAVAQVLLSNAPKAGIYVVPSFIPDRSKSSEDIKKDMQQVHEKIEKGPFAFVAIQPQGVKGTMFLPMVLAFSLYFIVALIISMILSKIGQSFGCRATSAVLISLLLGLFSNAPNYIWWHFASDYTVLMLIDTVVPWTIAGLLMARILGNKSHSM
jgi:small-conductance mechanosensitive channel